MKVVSVNVGQPREFVLKDRVHTSSIWKQPVDGPVRVRGVNVDGDVQADPSVHGGIDKAVYAYAIEDYDWWTGELGTEVAPATFGENLTTHGIDLRQCLIGERWRVGTVVVEVAQPRFPCFKLGVRMDDAAFPRRFARAERWGAYLRILEEGSVEAGDGIDVLSRPDHPVTLALIGTVYYHDHARAGELLAAEQLPLKWRTWALEQQ